MRGIAPTTADTIDRRVRAGEIAWSDSSAKMYEASRRRIAGNLTLSAMTWWTTRLNYYELITKQGIIVHPRNVIWKDAYDNEFIPEMQLIGQYWRPSHVNAADAAESKGTITTWYDGKHRALRQLGRDRLPEGQPFQLKSRAKHSAYKECADCQTKRLAVERAIRSNEPPDVIAAKTERDVPVRGVAMVDVFTENVTKRSPAGPKSQVSTQVDT